MLEFFLLRPTKSGAQYSMLRADEQFVDAE